MEWRAALRRGLRMAWHSRSVVWVLLSVNLAVAAISAFPIYRGIEAFTGHSLESERLASGFSPDWLTDFSFNRPGSLDRYAWWILIFGLLSILVNAILAGGVLARFRTPEERYALGDFCRSTWRYAWRLVRLMFIGLIAYWLVFRFLNQWLGGVAGRWTHDWLNDRSVFFVKLVVILVVLAGLVLVNLTMDFARVRLVMEDGTSAVEAFLASLGFSLARLPRALMVYAVPSLAGLFLLVVYRVVVPWHAVNAVGTPGSLTNYREPFVLALLFLGQQLIMFGRYWFRVATWASEWSLLAAKPVPEPPAPEQA